MKKSCFWMAICIWFSIAVTPVYASVIYTYTGNNFDTFFTTSSGSPSHNTTMNVTVSLEYATALPPNLSTYFAVPDRFSISDGINVIDNTNFTGGRFQVGTDSLGNINDWFIWGLSNQGNGTSSYIETINSHITSLVWDFGRVTSNDYEDKAWILDAPGSWTVATIPLPSAFWLFGSGLLMLIIGAAKKNAVMDLMRS